MQTGVGGTHLQGVVMPQILLSNFKGGGNHGSTKVYTGPWHSAPKAGRNIAKQLSPNWSSEPTHCTDKGVGDRVGPFQVMSQVSSVLCWSPGGLQVLCIV